MKDCPGTEKAASGQERCAEAVGQQISVHHCLKQNGQPTELASSPSPEVFKTRLSNSMERTPEGRFLQPVGYGTG